MKSFADHPKSKYWSDKNELKPHQVSYKSGKKFWFNCDKCPHSFESAINNIIRGQTWCPYHSVPQKKWCKDEDCDYCFKRSFASHEKEKYWSDKNELKPHQVGRSSGKKFWFNCDKCPHEFYKVIFSITRGGWCPYCAGKKICEDEGCILCFKRSFASHPKSQYWSNKNELNPIQVSLCDNRKYWFDCDKCPHTFHASCANISKPLCGRWCPYCSVPQKKFCENKECVCSFTGSFASHPRAKYWSDRNEKKPHQVGLGSQKNFWFDCDKCPHSFESRPNNISSSGNWCPYCAGKKLCGNKDCNHCLKRSFASYEKAKYWSKKNKLKPHQVCLGSQKNFWFDCDKCHNIFSSMPHNIVKGTWCPHCRNKTETKLLEWLQTQPFKVKYQYKPKWCSTEYRCIIKGKYKTRRYQYRYDFLVTLQNGKQLIIELDGPQHFRQVSNWKGPLHNQIRDAYKERKARQHKLKVIRILQEDVWFDRGAWEETLTKQLN